MQSQGELKWSYRVETTPGVKRQAIQIQPDNSFVQFNCDKYYQLQTDGKTYYILYKLNQQTGEHIYTLSQYQGSYYRGTSYTNVNGNCQIDKDNNIITFFSGYYYGGTDYPDYERFYKIDKDNVIIFNRTNTEYSGNYARESLYNGQVTILQNGDIITRNSLKPRLYCRDSSTGDVKWSFNPHSTSYQQGSPVLIGSNGTQYFSHMTYLYQLNYEGIQKWNYNLPSNSDQCIQLDKDDNIYLSTQTTYYIIKINPSGVKQWEYLFPDRIWGIQISSNNKIICTNNNSKIYQIDTDGNYLWEYDTGRQLPIKSTPQIGIDRKIYFGDDQGYFYCLNENGIFQWEYYIGQQIQGPITISNDSTQYFAQDNNYVYQIYTDSYGIDDIENNFSIYRFNSQQTARTQRSRCQIYNYYGQQGEETEEEIITDLKFLRTDTTNESNLNQNIIYIPPISTIYSNEKCIRIKVLGMQGTYRLQNFKIWQEPIGDTTGLQIKYGLRETYTKPTTTNLIATNYLPLVKPQEQNITIGGLTDTIIEEEGIYSDYIYLQLEIAPGQSYTGGFVIKFAWND